MMATFSVTFTTSDPTTAKAASELQPFDLEPRAHDEPRMTVAFDANAPEGTLAER